MKFTVASVLTIMALSATAAPIPNYPNSTPRLGYTSQVPAPVTTATLINPVTVQKAANPIVPAAPCPSKDKNSVSGSAGPSPSNTGTIVVSESSTGDAIAPSPTGVAAPATGPVTGPVATSKVVTGPAPATAEPPIVFPRPIAPSIALPSPVALPAAIENDADVKSSKAVKEEAERKWKTAIDQNDVAKLSSAKAAAFSANIHYAVDRMNAAKKLRNSAQGNDVAIYTAALYNATQAYNDAEIAESSESYNDYLREVNAAEKKVDDAVTSGTQTSDNIASLKADLLEKQNRALRTNSVLTKFKSNAANEALEKADVELQAAKASNDQVKIAAAQTVFDKATKKAGDANTESTAASKAAGSRLVLISNVSVPVSVPDSSNISQATLTENGAYSHTATTGHGFVAIAAVITSVGILMI